MMLHSSNMAFQGFFQLLFFAIISKLSSAAVTALPPSPVTQPTEPLRLTLSIHTVEGTNQLPMLGEWLTMQCNVWNRYDDRQATVWYKDNQFFATGGTLQGGVMEATRTTMARTVIPERSLEIDTLTIPQVTSADIGNYTCQLWQFHTNGVESLILFSKSYNVQLQKEAILATPECSPTASPLQVPSGDVVALECHVDLVQSMLSRNLFWTGGQNNQIYAGVTVIDSATHTAKMVLNILMREDYQNTSFVCHVNQTDGDEVHYRTCTVGPLFVLLPSTPTPEFVSTSLLPATSPMHTTPQRMTTPQGSTMSSTTSKKKSPRDHSISPFTGYIFIIVVIAAMLILFCVSCFACWLCCCRKQRRGRYSFRSRLNSRRKLMKTTSAATSEMEMPSSPHRGSVPAEFESPYYSSVGGGVGGGGYINNHGGIKLPSASAGRSPADGSSYTALQKTGNNSNSTIVEEEGRPRSHSAADALDDEGYNIVSIGNMESSKDHKDSSTSLTSPVTSPKSPRDSKSNESQSWSSSLRRGLSLNSLGRRSLKSRPTTPVGTPVDEAMPVYKTIMRPDKDDRPKTIETPYYLSVFPPNLATKPVADSHYEVTDARSTSGVKSSTVPKSRGGIIARNLERQGQNRQTTPNTTTENAKVGDDGYLCPTPQPSINVKPKSGTSASDPRFSNAMYNVFN